MRKYNNKKVYDCFNNPFPVYGGIPDLYLSPIIIDDSNSPNKSYRYNSDPLPTSISVTYRNYVSTLKTPSDSPQLLEINSDYNDTQHYTMNDNS